jgi:RNA-directed DNA polymerase
MLHCWRSKGIEEAQNIFESKYTKERMSGRGMPKLEEVLRGKIMFIGMVRGKKDPTFITFFSPEIRGSVHVAPPEFRANDARK